MIMHAIWLTFAVSVPLGVVADWVGAPPEIHRRRAEALAAWFGGLTARRRPRRATIALSARRANRRRLAAVASAVTMVGVGGGFALVLLSLTVLAMHLAGVSPVHITLAVLATLAVGGAFGTWWVVAAHAQRDRTGRAR